MMMIHNKWIKKLFITTTIIGVALLVIKRKDMTWRQSFLKSIYGVIMLKGKLFGTANGILKNEKNSTPIISIYSLKYIPNNGNPIELEQFKGKKILLVNTASDCGYTGQYSQLEELFNLHKSQLVIIGFPANDFKNQEQANDDSIAQFCKINYGVTFPIAKKSIVVKSNQQNPIFNWLSNSQQNGWCNEAPSWNFSKYLVDEHGTLMAYFSKDVSPLDEQVVSLLK